MGDDWIIWNCWDGNPPNLWILATDQNPPIWVIFSRDSSEVTLTILKKGHFFAELWRDGNLFVRKIPVRVLFFLNTTGQKTTATETETRLKSHTIKHHHGSGCFLERQWQPSGWWFYGGTNCWVDFWQAIFFWKLEVKNLFPVHHPIHKFNHCRPGKFCSWPFLDRSMTL